ncbi:RNA 2',3'-cyclic phosphodiesterase [Anaerovorax odorimutans]|uniref:RNA 2',3'-cyclic phosphodiesterase n=1 Tax=Anaerovorax odorimutans TaxID=109327 RepID=UPI0003FE8A80|nr:RNA 2',3'-cyclic phosphodiesterase [Anaerovorax odorimutans]
MRLFLAINFNKNIKQKLKNIQKQLKEKTYKGNFSREENFHLTLVFLGEISENKVFLIKNAMDNINTEAFSIAFNKLGVFKRNNKDIWWVGILENKKLLNMQKELSLNLLNHGFIIESRKYSPHITLAREVILKKDFDNDMLSQKFTIPVSVNEISLMRSERIHGKLTYTEVYKKSLLTTNN